MTALFGILTVTAYCGLQKDLVPVCRELGIGIVCYSPIGRGMLAGKYSKPEDIDPNDFRAKNPRFLEEAFAKVCLMLVCNKIWSAEERCH